MAGSTSQKIVISGEHQNELEETTSRTVKMSNYNTSNIRSSEECFVVDIDYLSLLGNERSDLISSSSSSNSTSTIHHFQRNLSRKGLSSSSSPSHQRGRKATQQTQKDTTAATADGGSSVGVGGGVVDAGTDHHHHHHESYSNKGASLMMTGTSNLNKQLSIIVVGGGGGGGGGGVGATTTDATDTGTENINNSINTKTVKETVMVTAESSKWRKRYNSIKQRSPTSSSSSFSNWMMDPRRILLFFATLSSMGTIILIYFTLSMAKLDGEDMVVSHSQPQ